MNARGASLLVFCSEPREPSGSSCVFTATIGRKRLPSRTEVLYVHLDLEGVPNCGNLVLLAGKLEKQPFHGTTCSLLMSSRNTLTSPCRSSKSWEFGDEWVEVERAWERRDGSQPGGLMTWVCARSSLSHFGLSFSQNLPARCRQRQTLSETARNKNRLWP